MHKQLEQEQQHRDMGLKKRRISFMLEENDALERRSADPLVPALTPEICKHLWYQPNEIHSMKMDTKDLLFHGVTKGGETDVTGLERFHFERSKHKKSAIRWILMSQGHNMGPDFVQSVSERCTAWAREIAAEQGFYDFCAAYDPFDNVSSQEEEFMYMDPCYSENGKRQRATPEVAPCSSTRRVRARSLSSSSQQPIST